MQMQMSSSDSSSESDSSPIFLGRQSPTVADDAFDFEYTFDPALVTLMPDPPPEMSSIPVRPNPILTPPKNGVFVFATCIFHASIVPEGTVIRTKPCPSNLRMISKNNLGCSDVSQGRFMDIMPTIMRNNKTAEDILKESMIACLSGVRSTCKTLEGAPSPESANPDQLAKMKSEVKLKCKDIEKIINDVGVNGLTELRTLIPKTQTEQLAILFNACEKGNALANSVYFGTLLAIDDSVLNKTNRLNVERFMGQLNYIDYGVPKNKYMPTKRYYFNEPFGFTRMNTDLDNFIDGLYGRLHLAVGLRLDDASYTVQLNVNLRDLKKSDTINPDTITLDEVIQLLVSPTLTRRVVDLVCEKYPALILDKNKMALFDLSANADTWQVALFDHGCSNIHVEGYPQLLYMGPEHNTTKKKKSKVVVLSAPAHGSRPPRIQTIRLKKMDKYFPGEKSDELFTTLMKKRKLSDSSSSSDETITPSTPKPDLTDTEGGSKRHQHKRRQTRHKRRQCKRGRTQRVCR